MEQSTYKYFAFISYNSADTEWGKKVQKKLEGYKMPATLCSEHGWERKPIKPVFFAHRHSTRRIDGRIARATKSLAEPYCYLFSPFRKIGMGR